MPHEYIILSRLHAVERRRLTRQKKNKEEERRRVESAKQLGAYSVIPIFRYHVAKLSLETPTVLNRHHSHVMPKHTTNIYRLNDNNLIRFNA